MLFRRVWTRTIVFAFSQGDDRIVSYDEKDRGEENGAVAQGVRRQKRN